MSCKGSTRFPWPPACVYIKNGKSSRLIQSLRSEKPTKLFNSSVRQLLMPIMRFICHLSIWPILSAFTAAKCDDGKATKKSFDAKSLTLREVGARNTVVCRQNHLSKIAETCRLMANRIGAFGWSKTATRFRSGTTSLSIRTRRITASSISTSRFRDGQTLRLRQSATNL